MEGDAADDEVLAIDGVYCPHRSAVYGDAFDEDVVAVEHLYEGRAEW